MTKEEVKRQLWRFGHSVKDVSSMPGIGYDLLVDEKIRLCIVGENSKKMEDCDVIATDEGGWKRYRFNKKTVEWKTPTEIFGPKSPLKTKRSKN